MYKGPGVSASSEAPASPLVYASMCVCCSLSIQSLQSWIFTHGPHTKASL